MNPGLNTRIAVSDGRMTIASVQDCTAIAERCKTMHNEGHHGTSELKFAGSIPDVFVNKYLTDNNITFAQFIKEPEHVRRMLRDPALAHFRVWKGAL